MRKTTTYSPEVRERAVRMVLEHLNDYPSEWAAIEAIAPKIGCAAQTLHGWIRRHQTDAGQRPGPTSEERERIKALEQALYARQPHRTGGLIHHSDRGSQYVSIRYTERLAEAGIEPSVGSKGDSYDNALAETING